MPVPSPRVLIAAVSLLSSAAVRADQSFGNTGSPPEQPGFFHRASDSIGGFFRRLFGNDEEARQHQQQQPRYGTGTGASSGTGRNQRHSLDQPPAAAQYATPSGNSGTRTLKEHDAAATQKNVAHNSTQSRKETSADTSTPPTRQKSKPVPSVGETIAPKTERKTPPPPPPVVADTRPDSTSKPPSPDTTAAAKTQDQNLPTGTKTDKAGRVKSPYPPNNELDVSGLPSGSLALDPTTQKIFRVP